MLTLGYLWEEYEKFWFFIMCHIFSIWLGFSGHSLLITTIKFSKSHSVFFLMCNKIKRELYATDCECFEIKFYTADQLPCFSCQMFKKWPFKLGRIYQTAHQNDGFNALRLCCRQISSSISSCSPTYDLRSSCWSVFLTLKCLSMMAKPDLITCNWHHYPRPPCAPSFTKSRKLSILLNN